MNFEVVVDSLASLAAFVAIVAALMSWYRTARKPLKVKRVVIHNKGNTSTFILIVNNVQSYPVTISRIGCYKQKRHIIQKCQGHMPEYSEAFSTLDQIFDAKVDFEVAPNGYSELAIPNLTPQSEARSYLFFLRTSHGYHECWCRDSTIVEIGKAEAYNLEYELTYKSRWPARTVYLWKKVLSYFRH